MTEAEFSMYDTALCHVQGELFTLAWDKGYVMKDFVPAFMKSESAARVDSPYSRLQWCGEEYLLSTVVRECLLFPNPIPGPEDREALYWAGYLYRYWHILTGEMSKEIYAVADLERMLRVYPGYHTLSCEMAIRRLKELRVDSGELSGRARTPAAPEEEHRSGGLQPAMKEVKVSAQVA